MSLGSADSREPSVLKVLVVEDNRADALLIQEYLSEVERPRFLVEHQTRLAPGLARLGAGGIDVLILDMSLPDSEGIATVLQVREAAPDVPIVVMSGLDDEAIAIRAVQEGAQDYLVKSRVDPASLVRSIRYAIQRHRIQHSLQKARKELGTRETAALERKPIRLASLSWLMNTLGQRRLSESDTQEMVRRLNTALSVVADSESWSVEAKVSAGLRSLAKDLARLRAGPRDVLDICSVCLKRREPVSGSASQSMPEERCARLALELMGHLVSEYLGSA
jgi:DNA-binding response OmpR family regulator